MKSNQHTILVVEDDLLIRQLYLKYLTLNKYTVIQAFNGEEGLQISLDQHPDLILLDLHMPVMDGLTMLKLLRKDQCGSKVKVILMTNMSLKKNELEEAESLNAFYMVKADNSLDVLKDTIKTTLNSSI